MFMSSRFPIEFFEQLVKKNMMRDEVIDDLETTLVDGDPTEDMHSLEETAEDRVITLKF
jgi:hypothetical protein